MAALVKCRCGYERATRRELRRRESVAGITVPCEACAKWANGHCECGGEQRQLSDAETLAEIRERQEQRMRERNERLAAAMRPGSDD